MNWIGWTTFGIAVVGATLGIFNAWWMVRRDAVRLRVRFVSIMAADGIRTYGFEVINLGAVPVTLTEVSFQRGRGERTRSVVIGDYFGRFNLPQRMEPRTSLTVVAHPSIVDKVDRARSTHCSAKTACGLTFRAKIRR